LFLLYINDLHNAIVFSSTNLFADDTMLFRQDISLKSLTKKINIDLKCLTNWLNANKISLNSSKTELLLFHPKRKPINYDVKIKINGQRLYPSDSVKYLGVIFDSKLNWDSHVNFVSGKLTRANGALSKLRYFVPQDILLSLYYALFHSHMAYSAQIWAQRENQITRRILTLQKRAVRLMTFSNFDSHSYPLFARLRILSFFDFVKFSNILFLYNLLNGELPSALYDSFDILDLTFTDRLYPRRTKPGLLRLPRVSTVSFGDYSLSYQSVLAWNLLQQYLPVDDLSTLRLSKLKYLVKFYFFSSYI